MIPPFLAECCEKVAEGIYVDRQFLQRFGVDPMTAFGELCSLPVHSPSKPICLQPEVAEIIPGSHKALNYRGHDLRRHKVWLQDDPESGGRLYRYTGWTWPIALATKHVATCPKMMEVAKCINTVLPQDVHHNHWIGTLYRDGSDNIGFHSDKWGDIDPQSWVVVVKLGAARLFEFRDPQSREVVWSERLPAGAAVFTNRPGNEALQHGVPPTLENVGMSGSLVGRCIRTVVPWDQVVKEAAKRTGSEALLPPLGPASSSKRIA